MLRATSIESPAHVRTPKNAAKVKKELLALVDATAQ